MNLGLSNSYEVNLSVKDPGRMPSFIPRSKSMKKTCENDNVKVELQPNTEEAEKVVKVSTWSEAVEGRKHEKCESVHDMDARPSDISLSMEGEVRREWPRGIKYADDEREEARQEKVIRALHDTIKDTKWEAFESIMATEDTPETPGSRETLVSTFQSEYNATLEGISDIWRNTVKVITAVKDHAVDFVEGTNETHDKEHLALEVEMLLLAVDFAVNYSKFKMDFLVRSEGRRLRVTRLEKSELENFLDSKTFAAFHNDVDLASMAQTVRDLKRSVLT